MRIIGQREPRAGAAARHGLTETAASTAVSFGCAKISAPVTFARDGRYAFPCRQAHRDVHREVTPQIVSASAGERDHDGLDDVILVELVGKGDADALGVLYQRFGTICYRLARQVTANDTLAEDAVQETFLGLWRQPGAYHPEQGSVRGWLLGLAHHKAVDFVRREAAQQRRRSAQAVQQALDPPTAPDPAAVAWTGIRAETVRAALAELPDVQREALTLAYFGGYTQQEIAQLTGAPLGTVKTRTLAAMRRLQMLLAALQTLPGEGSR
jgi:RNA polymerase sigma factor (sigma-70 family)